MKTNTTTNTEEDRSASDCSADFDAEKKAIEFQELFSPRLGS